MLLASLAACGSSTSTPTSTPDPFLGSWSCSFQAHTTYTLPPATMPMTSSMSFIDVVTAGAPPNHIVVTSTTDAGETCSLGFVASGTTASLAGTQTCMEINGLTNTWTAGTLTLSGTTHWSGDLALTISGTTSTGVQIQASATFQATCDRI
jgi:hypothetical protein